MTHRLRPLLIAGPTASGKSDLALAAARRDGGVVINADSMQVYRELRVLTARPSAEDEAQAPHRLYGHVRAADGYSVARWLEDVAVVLEEARRLGARPIIVGGTGLYFKALIEGLSPVPPIPVEVRARWREAAERLPAGELHRALAERDPVMGARLAAGDLQRIVRALEVLEATGRSLGDWQGIRGRALIDAADAERVLVRRGREELHRRADCRFDLMIEGGALDEVQALLRLSMDPTLPAMRALGVAPLAAHIRGEIGLAAAVERGKAETRQYVKRQETWARRFMSDWVSAFQQ